MKKTVLTIALAITVVFAGLNMAEARWGSSSGNGYGPGGCNGPRWSQESDVDKQAYQEFFEETSDLREQLFEKRNEYFDVMSQETPDKELASIIWSDMFDLKVQLQEKAAAAGIDTGFGKFGGRKFGKGSYNGTPCDGSGNCYKN